MLVNLEVVISSATKLRTLYLQKPPSVVLDRFFQSFIKSLCGSVISYYTSSSELYINGIVVKLEIVIEISFGVLPLIFE